MAKEYNITPVAKPRMTRSDRWKKRKCVTDYWAYKDEVQLKKVMVPEQGANIVFVLPMPKSWSKKEKARMNGQPHTKIPDVDNLLKGLMDACLKQDCKVNNVTVSKVWGTNGMIKIS